MSTACLQGWISEVSRIVDTHRDRLGEPDINLMG